MPGLSADNFVKRDPGLRSKILAMFVGNLLCNGHEVISEDVSRPSNLHNVQGL